MKVVDAIVEGKLGDIAIMAYNKSIADELKSKLEKTGYDWRVAQAGTVHSFGYGAWRKIALHVQIENKKMYNIVQECGYDQGGEIFLSSF
jgi:hypothetical protein